MTTTKTLESIPSGERRDLVETLRLHRGFLRFTVQGITDEQARKQTTVSGLTLGGLVKHVAQVEEEWAAFIVSGHAPGADIDWEAIDWENPSAEAVAQQESHRMGDGETLAGLLEHYTAVADRTDELVASLPDLDVAHPLPKAPWFEEGATWSARRTLLHVIAETAQHSGHADIIRESLDGQKTMG